MKLLLRIVIICLATITGGCLPEVETVDPSTLVEWENYTSSDGLAGTRVNGITQDSNGNLWAATDNGLSKFDGATFVNYRTNNSPLPSNYITSVVEFQPGVLVYGTDAALTINDRGNWQTIYFEPNTPYGVLSLGIDADGNGWVGTDYYGLLETDGNNNWWQWWDEQCFYCNFVNTILLDTEGTMWFGTQDGLKSRSNSGNWTRYTTQNGLPDNYIQSIFEDSWGTLWVGTINGLARYDGSSFEEVSLYNSANQNWTYTINEDRKKQLWLGSIGNGLIYFDGSVMRTDQASLADQRISTISSFRDKAGLLWFGTG